MKSLVKHIAIALFVIVGLTAAPIRADDAPIVPVDKVDWQVAPVRLLMVDQDGCIYCARWDSEIGPGYPKSSEGRAAPLLRVDINGPWPNGVVLDRRPTITPTFILLREGTEIDRLEGYPGDQYFYALIDEMLAKAGG